MTATKTMTDYLVCTPRDMISLRAAEFRHAVVAVLVLGDGDFGVESEDESQKFSPTRGDKYVEWLTEHGIDLEAVLRDELPAVAAALQSVMVGGPDQRRFIEMTLGYMSPEDGRKWLAAYTEDENHWAINTYIRRAHWIAAGMLAQIQSANPNT